MTEPRKRRRVRTEPAAGSDPTPQKLPRSDTPARAAEDTDGAWGGGKLNGDDNDERLKRDVPPHW